MGAKERVEAFNASKTKRYESLNEKIVSQRIIDLVDEDSFIEFGENYQYPVSSTRRDSMPGDGVATGMATINGVHVMVIAQDSEVYKGSLGVVGMTKIINALQIAHNNACIVVNLLDCAGMRIDEGPSSLMLLSEMLAAYNRVAGVAPLVSLVYGPVVGSLAMIPYLSHFVLMNKEAGAVTLNAPMVVAATEGKTPDHLALGGGEVRAKSGLVSILVEKDSDFREAMCDICDKLLVLVEDEFSESLEDDPNRTEIELDEIAMNIEQSVDMARIFDLICDRDTFVGLNSQFASDLVTGWGTLNGEVVGFLGSNSDTWTSLMCYKAIGFLEKAQSLNLPVINFVHGTNAEINSVAEQADLCSALTSMAKTMNECSNIICNVVVGRT